MSRLRILLSGASSFTGSWFVRALAEAGHDVTALFTRADLAAYGDDLRGARVRQLQEYCRPVFGCSFGDNDFLRLLESTSPEILCHHGADVSNYRSPEFDFLGAANNNTQRVDHVLQALADVGCNRVVLTGTVFEGGEGAGSDGLPHLSRYGLSKSLTATVFRHFSQTAQFSLGKFVIPNPFGPYEEPRFTAYLVRCWRAGETPCVQTPAYIRDNIHTSLLAKHYAHFVANLTSEPGFEKTNPSGYVESQGAFAQRFARELETRLDMPCPVELAIQTAFAEPRIRINTDPLDAEFLRWDETAAWDDVANFYAPTEVATPDRIMT